MKTPIKHGPFTLMVSLCGDYWVAPGGRYIRASGVAESVAAYYARRMQV